MGKNKNEEIKKLSQANKSLKEENSKLRKQLAAQSKVHEEELDLEKEKPVKELINELEEKHGSGMGNSRSRVQESDKETMNDGFAEEASKWQKDLAHTKDRLRTLAEKLPEYLAKDIAERIAEYKNGQIDAQSLIKQVGRLGSLLVTCKNILHQVTDEPNESLDDHNQQETGDDDESDIDTSDVVFVDEDGMDEATGPSRKRNSIMKPACGDLVLVAWDSATKKFQIIPGDDFLYFLHQECYEELGLEVADELDERPKLCLAKVVSTERCQAPKAPNQVNLPEETTYYLVRVKKSSSPLVEEEYGYEVI